MNFPGTRRNEQDQVGPPYLLGKRISNPHCAAAQREEVELSTSRVPKGL